METILEPFFLRALLAGLGVAAIACPLGCFVVWRRMAYFGDCLSHGALLGIAFALLLELRLIAGVIATSIALAVILSALRRQKRLADDTVLGLFAHGTLALGLVVLSFFDDLRVDLLALLFGDILAVGTTDLLAIYGLAILGLVTLALIWRTLLMATLHEDLARAEGMATRRVEFMFLILIALAIAIAMKVVGVLLITSLLIIPAAAARRFARTPETMAASALVIGWLSVFGGLGASLGFDTPAGPSIAVTAAALFLVLLLIGSLGLTRQAAEN